MFGQEDFDSSFFLHFLLQRFLAFLLLALLLARFCRLGVVERTHAAEDAAEEARSDQSQRPSPGYRIPGETARQVVEAIGCGS